MDADGARKRSLRSFHISRLDRRRFSVSDMRDLSPELRAMLNPASPTTSGTIDEDLAEPSDARPCSPGADGCSASPKGRSMRDSGERQRRRSFATAPAPGELGYDDATRQNMSYLASLPITTRVAILESIEERSVAPPLGGSQEKRVAGSSVGPEEVYTVVRRRSTRSRSVGEYYSYVRLIPDEIMLYIFVRNRRVSCHVSGEYGFS